MEGDRQLALPFYKLPTREELPEYYEVIETPMELELIRKVRQAYGVCQGVKLTFIQMPLVQRISRTNYPFDRLLRDLNIMFDNAQKYNKPVCVERGWLCVLGGCVSFIRCPHLCLPSPGLAALSRRCDAA